MKEIFLYFLRLGCLGFGGPLALVAQMQKELVQHKNWMSEEEFRQTFGLIKAMPGPVAFQTAVYLGQHRKGFWGGLLAAIGLVFPAFLLMIALAMAYQKFVEIPWMNSALKGMELAAFALIVWALKSLAQNFFKKYLFWVLFSAGILFSFLTSIPEPLLILLFGSVAVAAGKLKPHSVRSVELTLVWVCLKAGAFVFGTGLAIVPFLEGDFVTQLQWITHEQFMDALSFGQLTPGPVTITVAFIGYKVSGWWGATLATTAIFLPSFFHMVTWFPRMISWMKKQTWILAFSLGVTAAVCSAIVFSLWKMTDEWLWHQYLGISIAILVLFLTKIPPWALILLAGGIGASANFLSIF